MSALRICLLVPTYRRPRELSRLLAQCAALAARYRGPNRYAVVITDSDRANPLAAMMALRCKQYLVNPGVGLDENLLNFYTHHADAHDYVLSISDDDVFAASDVHPWLSIDAALAQRPAVVVINHVELQTNAQGRQQLANCYFRSPRLQSNETARLEAFLTLPPRHAGIVYAASLLRQVLPALSDFVRTQHLYVAPLLLSQARQAPVFVDLPLIVFSQSRKTDGAWEDERAVFDGLLRMVCKLRPHLSGPSFDVACRGDWSNYFGPDAWLRDKLVAHGVVLPTPDEVLGGIKAAPDLAGSAAAA